MPFIPDKEQKYLKPTPGFISDAEPDYAAPIATEEERPTPGFISDAEQFKEDEQASFASRFGVGLKQEFTGMEAAKKIPIAGGVIGTLEATDLAAAAKRLNDNWDYDKWLVKPGARTKATGYQKFAGVKASQIKDEKLLLDYMTQITEQAELGGAGIVASGLANMPTYMIEFAATGGLAKLGSGTAKIAGKKVLKRYAHTVAGRAALRTAGWSMGAITRASVGLAPRVAEAVAERRVSVNLDPKDNESPAESFIKGWGEVTIGAAAEASGGSKFVPRLLKNKTQLGKVLVPALSKAWVKVTGGTKGEFTRRLLAKGGLNNILGEVGEERLETVLQSLAATNDFGAGADAGPMDRLKAGLIQDTENFGYELMILGVAGGGQVAIGQGANIAAKRLNKLTNAGIKPVPIDEPSPEYELTSEGQIAVNEISDKLNRDEELTEEEMELLDIATTPNPVPSDVQRDMTRQQGIGNITAEVAVTDPDAVLNSYLADRHEQQTDTNRSVENYRQQIIEATGGRKYGAAQKRMDEAMYVYIDLKNNPDQIKYYDEITAAQQEVVDRARDLPPEIQAIANDIIQKNREIGEQAQDAGILKATQESYLARLWAAERRKLGQMLKRKFGTTTQRSKKRSLEGVMHGWAKGKTLQISTATGAHLASRSQVIDTLVDKSFLKNAKEWGVVSKEQKEGWVRLEHPSFSDRSFRAAKAKPDSKVKPVTVMENVPLYAEPKLAKHLNNIFGTSALNKSTTIKIITKANAELKRVILSTSFFHHQAYLRSYMLGSKTGVTDASPIKAYKAGKQAYENFTPELRLGVRNGLTLGKIQDYDASAMNNPNSVWSRMIKKAGYLGVPAQKINDLRAWNEDLLFNKLGPYLKTQSYLIEFAHLRNKHSEDLESGKKTLDEVAGMAARLINADFGGLNLERMGRNPTTQHIFHLAALAPDWTESNIRSALRAFKLGDDGAVYRAFWGRIVAKAAVSSVIANAMLSVIDEDDDFIERYQKAWEHGGLKWLDVDITPLYKLAGGKNDRRKYFSILGHFKDPYKFVTRDKIEEGMLEGFPDPVSSLIRSIKYKGSVATRMLADGVSGKNWAGRKFTSMQDLMSGGQLTEWSRGGADPLGTTQVPSFLIYEARQNMPIQMQQGVGFLLGQVEGFDAVAKSIGFDTHTAYEDQKVRQI